MPTYPNLHFDSLVRHQKMRFSQTKKYLRHPQVVLSNPPTAVGVSCTILKIAVFTSIWAPYWWGLLWVHWWGQPLGHWWGP